MNDISSTARLEKVEFKDVLPIWENLLWPNRRSSIKPMSSMTHDEEIDMSIYEKFKPTFFAIKIGDEIVGVNSGHRTSMDYYRSRGLYVKSDYRGQGHAKVLLDATVDQAKKENCSYVWTCPRLSSIKAYNSTGFRRSSSWTYEMEFGPNCYAMRKV